MSKTNLFLPRRIKVGFQNRSDTYTGQLAYIIYFDEKNKLRKEASWESWRDQKIEPQEFDNEPTDGFVLNKKVGGTCWSQNYRQTYVRVYDPRGFEFEITVPNLLYILENTSSIKGKGLDGKFVYGWDGTDLVLIPVSSPDYEELVSLNNKRFDGKKIYAKDLKIGATYLTKEGYEAVFLGKYQLYDYALKFDGKYFLSDHTLRKYAADRHLKLEDDSYDWYWNRKRYYEYESYAPVGEAYFFSRLDDPETIDHFKSISGRLISVVSEDCVQDYHVRYGVLESSPSFSPPDPSQDKMVDVTLDEFRWRVMNNRICAICLDGRMERIDFTHRGDRFKISWLHYDGKDQTRVIKLLTNMFGEPERGEFGWWLSDERIDELHNRLHVVHIDHCLKNGKVYRRDY